MKTIEKTNGGARSFSTARCLALLGCGLLCFCAPQPAGVDFLPDALGYLLILLAIGQAALFSPHLAEVRPVWIRLIPLGIARAALGFYLPRLYEGNVLQVTQALLILCGLVLDLALVLPALRRVFGGLSYLGEREDCPALYAVPAPRRLPREPQADRYRDPARYERAVQKYRLAVAMAEERERLRGDRSQRICKVWVIFFLIRDGLILLPELLSLAAPDSRFAIVRERMNVARGLAGTVILAAALWAIFKTARYLLAAGRDKAFAARLRERWQREAVPDPGALAARDWKSGLLLLGAGCWFLPDLIVYHADDLLLVDQSRNLLPDWIGLLCFLAGWLLLRRSVKKSWLYASVVVLCLPVSVLAGWAEARFFASHDLAVSLVGNAEALAAYRLMCVCNLAEVLCTLALMLALVALVRRGVLDNAEGNDLPNDRTWRRLLWGVIAATALCGGVSALWRVEFPRLWLVHFVLEGTFAVLFWYWAGVIRKEARPRRAPDEPPRA